MSEQASRTPARESRHYGKNVLIAILVGLLINILLGFLVDFGRFKAAILEAKAWEILLPFAAILAVYLVDSLRYLLVFRQFGIRLRFREALYNNVIGYFFSNVTPSSAGGQPFQVLHFHKLGIDTATSTNVIFSRLLAANLSQLLIVLVFMHRGIVLLSASGNGAWILGLGMVTTAFFSLLLLLIFVRPTLIGRLALWIEHTALGRLIARLTKNGAWAEGLSTWSEGLKASLRFLWSENPLTVLADFVLFICDQVIWALGLYFPLVTLSGVSLPFGDFLFAFIVCGIVAAYVPTPGASGSVEAAYALVLGGMVGSFDSALTAVFLWRIGCYYLHLFLGGLVYAFAPVSRREFPDKAGPVLPPS